MCTSNDPIVRKVVSQLSFLFCQTPINILIRSLFTDIWSRKYIWTTDRISNPHSHSLHHQKIQWVFRSTTMAIIFGPASAFPSFIGRRPGNPNSLSKWIVLCVTMCLTLATIVFILRTYVRIGIKRKWIVEDSKSSHTSVSSSIQLTFCRHVLCFLGEHTLVVWP